MTLTYSGHTSKRKKGHASKRGKYQRASTRGSPLNTTNTTTADEESSSSTEMKIGEHCKSVEVNMDPDLLGPCEPGTEVVLEGIIWTESIKGALAVNVTWKGRTYVGTLLESSSISNLDILRDLKDISSDSARIKHSNENCFCIKSEDTAGVADVEPKPASQANANSNVKPNNNNEQVDRATSKPAISQSHVLNTNPTLIEEASTTELQRQQHSTSNDHTSNPIQKLEMLTSNHINSIQSKPNAPMRICNPLSSPTAVSLHKEQSPINALSSFIEGTTSVSGFDRDSRSPSLTSRKNTFNTWASIQQDQSNWQHLKRAANLSVSGPCSPLVSNMPHHQHHQFSSSTHPISRSDTKVSKDSKVATPAIRFINEKS
ncbi:hypothetical protein GJ496_005270 [Pomphorhynchus laevis]|nr:hypothetical protein GJ496_005270 [Pomphorhynchus laevis]